MFLKSLHLQGFKSFADKTHFEFHEGVTSIVGPNGCGKSNVVDAIRWVLGETSAKALRGGEMADVIFSGTDKRKAHGMAEVTLLLADCEEALKVDFNEVAIGRRVFRDGHSEYLINNKACRLRDVHEMLMDTGIGRTSYSIMEQGKIDMLLSSKPEDRRAVFEEAAGITKFKTQKKEALRKLEYTEANLLRLADIIAEVKRQMGSLQRQAAKARRYQNLAVDLRTLDAHLSKKRYEELRAEKAELQASIASLRQRHNELEKEIEGKESEITHARDSYQELESQIASARQNTTNVQNEVQTALNRIGFNDERAVELRNLLQQNSSDIESTEGKLSQQELDLRFADETLSSVEQKVASHQVQLAQVEERQRSSHEALERIQEEMRVLQGNSNRAESEIVTARAQIQNLVGQLETDRQRAAQLAEELVKLCADRDERRHEKDRLQAEVYEHRRTIEIQEQDLIGAEKSAGNAAKDIEALQNSLREMHRTLAEKESRLHVLQELVALGEGFQEGTQALLRGLNHPEYFQSRIRGVLASFVEADEEFAPAIEAALGRHLQTVLVSDAALAEQVIETLTAEKLGEACILPADFFPAAEQVDFVARPQGSVAWAIEKVRVAEGLRPLVQKLLANVLLVPDIHTALSLRHIVNANVSYVTLRGEFVSPLGIIRGGAGNEDKGSVLRRQNEVRQLTEETALLRANVDSFEAKEEQLAAQQRQCVTNLELTRDRLQHTRVNHSTIEGQCALVDREIQQADSKIESQEWEQKEVQKRAESTAASIAELRSRLQENTAALEGFHARSRELNGALENTRREAEEAARSVSELRTALAVERRTHESLSEQRLPMTERMRELEEMLERRRGEIASYTERIATGTRENEQLSATIEEKRGVMAGLETALGELEGRRGEHAVAVERSETELVNLRRELSKSNEQRGNEEIQTTQLDLRIENLNNIITQRYNIHLDTFEPDSHALLNAIESQKKARSRSEKRRATMAAQAADGQLEEGDDAAALEAEDLAADIEVDIDETVAAMETVPGESGPDWAFVKEIVGELKQSLDSMGAVNIDAIEEFDELEERHTFLHDQHEDLVNSKEELLRVIAKINKTTRKMFAETFEKVRENFQSVFNELFGKGSKSDLILLDESDPLESGIDIVAKPPGKTLQSIRLLSGGERSMTAVALLFAIYMVKPSPFCVLDELDAPLDEANIGRFLKVLDRFIDDSQFIVITHNKRTMNRADVLYGVTMEEFGVSKRVGVKLTGSSKESDIPAPNFNRPTTPA